MKTLTSRPLLALVMAVLLLGSWHVAGQNKPAKTKGWVQGKGWGWIWGKDDEVGALNAMDGTSIRNALMLAKEGKTFDLGVTYTRKSFKWPGHNAGEIMTYRSPEG